jgi:hypothetical protein
VLFDLRDLGGLQLAQPESDELIFLRMVRRLVRHGDNARAIPVDVRKASRREDIRGEFLTPAAENLSKNRQMFP